jgi:hypothetical protein
MKQGKSIVELAQEIERQSKARVDVIADTRQIEMTDNGRLRVPQLQQVADVLPITEHAHDQIGARVNIPAKYYDRMRAEAPDLLAANVNRWLKQNPEKRMLRTMDGKLRAFLSNRYQRIDNNHVAEAVLPVLAEVPGIRFASAEITESRLYIKAITSAVQETVPGSRRTGDFVQAGVLVTNSEIGLGALHVKPFMEFLVCTNGMVRDDIKRRFNHVGKQQQIIEDAETIDYSDTTRRLEDLAVLSKVRDVVRAALDETKFRETVARLGETTTQRIEGDPVGAIEVLANSFGMIEQEKSSVLRHLIEGADLSRFGLIQAVTRTANDLPSYDRATQFEAFGGTLLALPNTDWKAIANARVAA